MGAKKVNELGTLGFSDEVLATMAGVSAMECYGIVGMASKRATDGLVELLGMENLSRGVKVHTQDESVVVDLYIIVEYGISISTVARNIIDTVKYNLENLTGLNVIKVNIMVEGVRV